MRESLLIHVGGVGYEVKVTPATLTSAQQKSHLNQDIELFIYTHVREEALDLFGFATLEEKELFMMVLNVSGVGPKTALLLTDRGQAALVTAVQTADVAFFTGIPRVGKKLGQKIIIELKSKLGSLQELSLANDSAHRQDIREALTSLGFAPRDIDKGMQVAGLDELSLEAAVKAVMKHITTT